MFGDDMLWDHCEEQSNPFENYPSEVVVEIEEIPFVLGGKTYLADVNYNVELEWQSSKSHNSIQVFVGGHVTLSKVSVDLIAFYDDGVNVDFAEKYTADIKQQLCRCPMQHRDYLVRVIKNHI
jgi:hypothetical protein